MVRKFSIFVLALALFSQSTFGSECFRTASNIGKTEYRKGFTLMELLVVTAIVGVLVGITIPGLSKSRSASRNAKCFSNLHQAQLATMMYEDMYRSLPVDHIYNTPPVHADVDLRKALEMVDSGAVKAFQCPDDKGRWVADSDEAVYHSYIYYGLTAMMSRRPPYVFDTRNARINYEKDSMKPLYYRMPLWFDARSFHEARHITPDYDGKTNAAYYDGSVQRMPDSPPSGPPPPP